VRDGERQERRQVHVCMQKWETMDYISPLLIRIEEGMQRRFAKGLRGELMLLFCMREKRESDTIREGCIFT